MKRVLSLICALALASSPAAAQMMLMTGAGLGASASVPPTITYRTNSSVNNSFADTTCTFTSQDIGTASASRRVIVGVGTWDLAATAFTSVDIGGTAATQVVHQLLGSTYIADIWIANVTSGTSVTITVTGDGDLGECFLGIWDAQDLTSSTAVDTGASTADPFSDTLTTAVGVAVGFRMVNASTTWTGLTENFDAGAGGSIRSGASATTTAGSLAITADSAGTPVQATVAATFQ